MSKRASEVQRVRRTALERSRSRSPTSRRPAGMSISSPMTPTREAIAKAAGVAALPRLEAGFDLTRHGRRRPACGRPGLGDGRAELRGDARADRERDRRGDRSGVPARRGAAGRRRADCKPVDADDPPEPLRDGVVDLGARGHRVSASGNRSLSAQARRRVRRAAGRRSGEPSVRGAGGAEEGRQRRKDG